MPHNVCPRVGRSSGVVDGQAFLLRDGVRHELGVPSGFAQRGARNQRQGPGCRNLSDCDWHARGGVVVDLHTRVGDNSWTLQVTVRRGHGPTEGLPARTQPS